jgi:hypothetical protein
MKAEQYVQTMLAAESTEATQFSSTGAGRSTSYPAGGIKRGGYLLTRL